MSSSGSVQERDREVAGEKTRADLELGRVLAALAERCASAKGRLQARSLPFLQTVAEAEAALREVAELRALDDRGESPGLGDVPLLDEAFARMRIAASLSLEEVGALRIALRSFASAQRFLKHNRESLGQLLRSCPLSDEHITLLAELERALDDDGGIADGASARLAELRSERKASRQRMMRKLDELLARHTAILSDSFWTERDGRYVLPIRSDAHDRVLGIVHGASAGGATLFLEPREMVGMGNRHKMLEASVLREEEIVLARLSALAHEHREVAEVAVEQLAHLDVRYASARLSFDLRLTTPTIATDAGEVRLDRARHPILLLDGVSVVPSDLALASGQVLVVSGPNAGGKTVALKTLGLAALMVRLGLPVAAAEGSVVPWFDNVLTDVGDEQSISKNLSTFSAHIRNLAQILENAGKRTLVLLDEIASGTDPREGEALATAILERLAEQGAAVVCATHYEALKLLALADRRFLNASVGFNLDTMQPTFELLVGLPGPSSALSVASRFGIPAVLVARASSLLSEQSRNVSELVNELAEKQRALSERLRQADELRDELLLRERTLKVELETLRDKRQAEVTREADALLISVKQARQELRAAQAKVRSAKGDGGLVADAQRAIDRVASKVAIGGSLEPNPKTGDASALPPTRVTVGMKVFVPRLRTDADVLEVTSSGQLRLAAGPLKLLVRLDEVRTTKQAAPKAKSKQPVHIPFDAAADDDVPLQTSDNAVDLRGLRAHEVLPRAEQFLDRCIGSGLKVAFLIHGHGTGALRNLLRDELRGSRYVERFRPGEPREGGDGVTVVWLR